MRKNLTLTSKFNHDIVRPFEKSFPTPSSTDSIEDSASQVAKKATQEGAQLKLQSSLAEQESQLPPQSKSKKTVIRELHFKIINVETAKYKLIDEFNELGIWHQNIIKDLGSKEFITKLIDLNSYNPEELTENQAAKITVFERPANTGSCSFYPRPVLFSFKWSKSRN